MTQEVLLQLGTARGIGVFSWPVAPGPTSMTSSRCHEIVGAEVSDCDGFREHLTPDSADAFEAALQDNCPFTLQLQLTDSRLAAMTADCEGVDADRRVSGTLEDISGLRTKIADLIARGAVPRDRREFTGDALDGRPVRSMRVPESGTKRFLGHRSG